VRLLQDIIMRKVRLIDDQVLAVLMSVDAGQLIKEVSQQRNITEANYYHWNKTYSAMEAAEITLLTSLMEQNRHLQKIFADLSVENRFRYGMVERHEEIRF